MAFYLFKDIRISGVSATLPENFKTIENSNGNRYSFYYSNSDQTASDLGFIAAKNLLKKKDINTEDLGILVFCTCTPDYPIPSTSFVLHNRLNLSENCLVFDINISESGFIYGLQVVCSILLNINKRYGLLIVGDTMSKLKPAGVVYSDSASAILLEKRNSEFGIKVKNFSSGNDFSKEIFAAGAYRHQHLCDQNHSGMFKLKFDSSYLNLFFKKKIKSAILNWLSYFNKHFDNYDYLVLRESDYNLIQDIANEFSLTYERFLSSYSSYSDAGISSVPLTISHNKPVYNKKTLSFLVCSFGAGLSWGVAEFSLKKEDVLPVIKSNEAYKEGFVRLDERLD